MCHQPAALSQPPRTTPPIPPDAGGTTLTKSRSNSKTSGQPIWRTTKAHGNPTERTKCPSAARAKTSPSQTESRGKWSIGDATRASYESLASASPLEAGEHLQYPARGRCVVSARACQQQLAETTHKTNKQKTTKSKKRLGKWLLATTCRERYLRQVWLRRRGLAAQAARCPAREPVLSSALRV